MVHYPKPATSIQQQIAQLQSEGLIIPDIAQASKILEHIAYYRLRAYWIIFETSANPRKFKPNTNFNDVLNLYLFDEELRTLTLSLIAKIEVSLRANFSNLSIKFNNPHFYLEHNNFKQFDIYIRSLSKIQNSLKNNKDELFIAHYLSKYTTPQLPPVWSVAEILTIGELYYWIINLHDGVLDEIAKNYGFSSREVFISGLERLSIIRNVCAHHNRLWNRIIVKKQLKQVKQKNYLSEALSQDEHSNKTFYGTFCYIIYILKQINQSSANDAITKFNNLISKYQINLKSMGFSDTWQELPLFNRQ
ncbi:MAG: Abi family protein [Burkholderiales bacterium]|jgi:abortive infection bacteriophage resistance protein|nr:Abi family protein [Burkholderiales bacterium]